MWISTKKLDGRRILFRGAEYVPGMRPMLVNDQESQVIQELFAPIILVLHYIPICAVRTCVCGDMITVLWLWYTRF